MGYVAVYTFVCTLFGEKLFLISQLVCFSCSIVVNNNKTNETICEIGIILYLMCVCVCAGELFEME